MRAIIKRSLAVIGLVGAAAMSAPAPASAQCCVPGVAVGFAAPAYGFYRPAYWRGYGYRPYWRHYGGFYRPWGFRRYGMYRPWGYRHFGFRPWGPRVYGFSGYRPFYRVRPYFGPRYYGFYRPYRSFGFLGRRC